MTQRSIAVAAPADVAAAPHASALTKDHKKVIFASSLGTVFEWYDFYLYGSLAAIITQAVLLRRQRDRRLHLRADGVRRRLRGAALRRAVLRAPRRPGRPQVHLPGHHPADGRLDLRRRPAADLRRDRHRCADHPHRAAPAAGPRARRRIRRRRDLCRRACAAGQARAATPAGSRPPRRSACSCR